MDLTKISEAMTVKYELYDITGKRLLPKEIVAAYISSDKKIHRGIIFAVYRQHTKILDETGNYYLVTPEKQLIITKPVDKEPIYELLIKKYNDLKAEAANENHVYTKFVFAAYINSNDKSFGIALLPVQFSDRQTFTEETWQDFKNKYTNLSDRIYFPLTVLRTATGPLTELVLDQFRDFKDIHEYNAIKLFGITATKTATRYKFMNSLSKISANEINYFMHKTYRSFHFDHILGWASSPNAWNKFCLKYNLNIGLIKNN